MNLNLVLPNILKIVDLIPQREMKKNTFLIYLKLKIIFNFNLFIILIFFINKNNVNS